MALRALAAAAIPLLASAAPRCAADVIRVAVQKTGTVAWEIAVMKARGLDKAAGLDVETTRTRLDRGRQDRAAGRRGGHHRLRLAVGRAGALAWRQTPVHALFVPRSARDGGKELAASIRSPISRAARLASPADRSTRAGSWLQAARSESKAVDLARSAHPAYGAPPLIAEKLAHGELDAALEFWNFCVDLESARVPSSDRHDRRREGAWRERAGGDDRLCVQRRASRAITATRSALSRHAAAKARDGARRTIRRVGADQGSAAYRRRRRRSQTYRTALSRRRSNAPGRRRRRTDAKALYRAIVASRGQGTRRRRARSSTLACFTIPPRRSEALDRAAAVVLALIVLWR